MLGHWFKSALLTAARIALFRGAGVEFSAASQALASALEKSERYAQVLPKQERIARLLAMAR